MYTNEKDQAEVSTLLGADDCLILNQREPMNARLFVSCGI